MSRRRKPQLWKATLEVRREYEITIEAKDERGAALRACREFEATGLERFALVRTIDADCWFADPIKVGRRRKVKPPVQVTPQGHA